MGAGAIAGPAGQASGLEFLGSEGSAGPEDFQEADIQAEDIQLRPAGTPADPLLTATIENPRLRPHCPCDGKAPCPFGRPS